MWSEVNPEGWPEPGQKVSQCPAPGFKQAPVCAGPAPQKQAHFPGRCRAQMVPAAPAENQQLAPLLPGGGGAASAFVLLNSFSSKGNPDDGCPARVCLSIRLSSHKLLSTWNPLHRLSLAAQEMGLLGGMPAGLSARGALSSWTDRHEGHGGYEGALLIWVRPPFLHRNPAESCRVGWKAWKGER